MSRKNYYIPRLKPVYTGSMTYDTVTEEVVRVENKTVRTTVITSVDEEYYASMKPESYNKYYGTYHVMPADYQSSSGEYAKVDSWLEFLADEFLMSHARTAEERAECFSLAYCAR